MKRINSLTQLIATLLLMTGCVEEATTPSNGKSNQQEPDTKGLTAFVEDVEIKEGVASTRTTAEYFDNGGLNRGLHYYWTEGDRLWVNNGGTLIQDVSNNINSKLENNPAIPSAVKRAATAKFYFNGTFTASSYPVRYTGKGSTTGDKVTIKAQQTQTIPNDASHIGEDGDCGTAVATKPAGGGKYNFTLSHEASYITFLPYTSQGVISGAKLQKIKVSADQAICGTFDFNDNGIDIGSRPTAAPANQSIELSLNSFSIPNTATIATNVAAMVIAPGSYTHFTVEYTLYDPITLVIGTITKQYPSTITFIKGKNKRISQDLQVRVYPGNGYYLRDAAIGQHAWKGFEWDGPNPQQPTVNNQSNGNYPQNDTDPRWHSKDMFPVQASRSCANCPNVNELCWYIKEGTPYWDTELWATMGHLYTGGMWIKKLSAIAGSLGKTTVDLKEKAPDGTDYRTNTDHPNNYNLGSNTNITQGRPSNLNDYFYLPAIGLYYDNGGLSSVGVGGTYWSCSSAWYNWYSQYTFSVYESGIFIDHGMSERNGFHIWKTDDSDNQYRPNGM